MIGQLRRKFIATNMLLVSLVLLAAFGVQTFSVYRQARDQVDRTALQALAWARRQAAPGFEFVFPEGRGGGLSPEKETAASEQSGERKDVSFTMAFSVETDLEGQVLALHAGPGVTVTRETAQTLMEEVLSHSGERGRLSGKNLSYLRQQEGDRLLVAFADDRLVGETVRRQVVTSLLISAAALLAFYLISRFLARVSVKPIERAWEQQRQFVADASHELKTPLAVILANADLVLAHPEDTVEGQRKWLGYIREEAQRMRGLVEDLLFLAKSDAARRPVHPVQVRLSEVVTASVLPFESVAFEQGVTLEENISPGLTLSGDEGQLRRLVVILLDNGVKYAGTGGSVTVTLEEEEPGKLRLAVHNTGPAIPAEHLPHLFERFYRSDAARDREAGGYGLGLAIAQSIVNTHGGKITVDSAEGRGTTFTVRLPRR